ncbi:DMT family transporter [uncultured Sphingomonas sp.]|uniref:DMT family transporter n=1 Tax=uncultured Sphingomonas sp. TaxID=158754 RepID=UPI0025D9697F|nr:DMT family transporter [uncultured Sphingomonas sp.]
MTPFTLAAVLMIVSGSVHAVVNAIVKGGRDKMAARALTDGASALILLPVLPFVAPPVGAYWWLAASTAAHLIYLFALIRAFEQADLSAAYPVLRGTAPLLTAVVTIGLLGEPVRAAQVAGIALIGAAMLLLVMGRDLGRGALGWSLLTGCTIALYTVIDAHGVRAAPSPASYIVWLFVAMGVGVTAMFALLSRGRIIASVGTQWRAGVVAGALSIVTYGAALTAFALGPTAPLAGLRETGMVTALLIGVLALGERVRVQRAGAVAAILGGAALILAG